MPQKQSSKTNSVKPSTKSVVGSKPKSQQKQATVKKSQTKPKQSGFSYFIRSKWAPVCVFAVLFGGLGLYYMQSSQAATACNERTFRYKDKDAAGTVGGCITQAQTLLKQRGYLSGKIDGSYGPITTNAVINFQRAQSLTDDGILGRNTWEKLFAPSQVATKLDARCLTGGVVFCASQAQRKLYFIKNGSVVTTVDARFGGMAWDAKLNGGKGGYRVHRTGKGTFYVYARVDNPVSKTYGEDKMPYSLMFDKNMYIHYSADFAKVGYSGASHGCINVRDQAALIAMYNDIDVKRSVKQFANTATHATIFQPANKSAVRVVVY